MLCDFKNTERMLIVEDVFTGERPIVYLRDFYFSSRDLAVTTVLQRKADARIFLGNMLQLAVTGQMYFVTEICRT